MQVYVPWVLHTQSEIIHIRQHIAGRVATSYVTQDS